MIRVGTSGDFLSSVLGWRAPTGSGLACRDMGLPMGEPEPKPPPARIMASWWWWTGEGPPGNPKWAGAIGDMWIRCNASSLN